MECTLERDTAVEQPFSSQNEPLPRFRIDFEPMELPFTCTISGEKQKLATCTLLDAGYVMVDPESRQAVCIVTSSDLDNDADEFTAEPESDPSFEE